MERTTVYLPRELKRALSRMARRQGRSEAALLREAVERLTSGQDAPAPRLPLGRGRGPSIAERVDEVLKEGFGRK
jgi:Arc/MetJ-type ribon-helix-helix transcriptional regulator